MQSTVVRRRTEMATSRSKVIPNWMRCESCGTIVEQNKFELHTLHGCPPTNSSGVCSFGYIHEKRLFSFLKVEEGSDVDGKFKKYLNDIVRVSLSALQLCEFAIGESVVILAKSGQRTIKSIWPTDDYILSSVLLTKQSMEELNHEEDIVEIRKIEPPPLLATTVYVQWLEEAAVSEKQISEITDMLSGLYNNTILTKGQNLIFRFFGLKCKLKVVDITSHRSPEEEIDTLNDALASIKLHDEKMMDLYYRILINTDFKFANLGSKEEENNDTFDLSNLGGLDDIIVELKDIVSRILTAVHSTRRKISGGILIHGVPGTGKTTLAKALIRSTTRPVIHVCSWQIFSRYFGEAENRVKTLFQDAIEKAPSVIFIDELDTFCPGKNGSEQEKRVLAVLLSMLDKLNDHRVTVIGVTRRLEDVDAALRRPGRFDFEFEIPVPDANARVAILRKLMSAYKHNVSNELIENLGRNMSHGFVGSDLSSACTLASTRAISKGSGKISKNIEENDLIWAFNQVKPSAMREILVQVPNVKWSDIGGQGELKLNLEQIVEWPLKYPDSLARLGITPTRGVLLFGPPGCSKTMIAKAVATESKLNFISIKGAELFSKWVGESEKAVREVFHKARTVSPSVIFFDEIDAISGERDADSSSGSNVQDRVLSQLLTEMDGIEQLNGVAIIAATNRPDRIDSALLRPGRLDRRVYVPLPDAETREAIFTLQFAKTPVHETVDVKFLVSNTSGYSGAEVVAICHEAAMKALQQDMSATCVLPEHFEHALKVVTKQTPSTLLRIYDKFLEKK